MSINVAIVIVTYNRSELLKECVSNVLSQTILPNRLIIIDNASTDGTSEWLDKEISCSEGIDISILHQNSNLGGSGGFYEGLKAAYKTGSDWIVLIDDDAMLSENYIEEISNYSESHPDIKMLSGRVESNGAIDYYHRRKLVNGSIEKKATKSDYKKDSFEYSLGSFCGMAFRRDLIKKIGLPNKDFFILYDDTEYCYRAAKLGEKAVNLKSIYINHKTKLDVENKNKKMTWKNYYNFRNLVYMYRKHHKLWMLAETMGYLSFLYIENLCPFYSDVEHRANNKKTIRASVRDGFAGRMGKNEEFGPWRK